MHVTVSSFLHWCKGSELRFFACEVSTSLKSSPCHTIKKTVEMMLLKITGAHVSYLGARRAAGEIHGKHAKDMHMMRTAPL